MAKGNKLAGLFAVVAVRSVIVGCMSWETPCLILKHIETGVKVQWVSDKVAELGLNNSELTGKWLVLTAHYRPGVPYYEGYSNNLYRVTVHDAPPEMNYYHRQKAWAADKQLAL